MSCCLDDETMSGALGKWSVRSCLFPMIFAIDDTDDRRTFGEVRGTPFRIFKISLDFLYRCKYIYKERVHLGEGNWNFARIMENLLKFLLDVLKFLLEECIDLSPRHFWLCHVTIVSVNFAVGNVINNSAQLSRDERTIIEFTGESLGKISTLRPFSHRANVSSLSDSLINTNIFLF